MPKKNIEGWDSLHPKQQKLYEMLLHPQEDATLETMREELDVQSLNTVVHHLKQLEKKGYIRKNGDFGRIEALPAPVRDIVYLSLYGMARCGQNGFFNDGNVIDRIPFPAKQLRINPDSFLVEARGDSMKPMIHDKDLVLVDKVPVENGDTAVVVHEGGALIKKVFSEKKRFVLQSLNSKYEPIVASPDEVNPVGVVRGVVRSFPEENLRVKKSRP